MALTRKAPAAAGVALLALAALVVVVPGTAKLIPMGAAVQRLGNDYIFVAVVAALALGAFLLVLLARAATGVSEATPPAVEGTTPGAPGRAVDESLDALPPVRMTDRHRDVHERVRTAAVEAVAEADGCSRSAARERIESGEWTDDAEAAAFVANDDVDPPGVPQRVATRLRRRHWFRERIETTVAALETLDGDSV